MTIKCIERVAYVYTEEKKVFRQFKAQLQEQYFLIYGQQGIFQEDNNLIIEEQNDNKLTFYNCKFSILNRKFEILKNESFANLSIEEQLKELKENYIVTFFKNKI